MFQERNLQVFDENWWYFAIWTYFSNIWLHTCDLFENNTMAAFAEKCVRCFVKLARLLKYL